MLVVKQFCIFFCSRVLLIFFKSVKRTGHFWGVYNRSYSLAHFWGAYNRSYSLSRLWQWLPEQTRVPKYTWLTLTIMLSCLLWLVYFGLSTLAPFTHRGPKQTREHQRKGTILPSLIFVQFAFVMYRACQDVLTDRLTNGKQ